MTMSCIQINLMILLIGFGINNKLKLSDNKYIYYIILYY